MKRTVDNETISVLQWQICASSALQTTFEKLTQCATSYETQKPNTQNYKNNVCARSKLKSVECLSTAHSMNINATLNVQLCKHTKQIATTQHDSRIQTHLKASKQSMFSALLVCTVASLTYSCSCWSGKLLHSGMESTDHGKLLRLQAPSKFELAVHLSL